MGQSKQRMKEGSQDREQGQNIRGKGDNTGDRKKQEKQEAGR